MHTNSRFVVAIHILTLLAFRREEALTSETIASSVTTNPVVIRRTLGELRKAGLVCSQPGNRGGWRLLRAPERITLLDAYHAVQKGPPFAFPSQCPNPNCCIGKTIHQALTGVFDEVEQAMAQQLAQFTVADVLARVQP